MKVLVTGGTGFTGSHLVRRLLERGHQVRVIDNQPGLFYEELKAKGAAIELASITDGERVAQIFDSPEVVYHLAAAFRQLNVPDSYYRNVNVEGTRHLLELSQRAGVRRFVYCSTQGVHGDIASPPGDEDSPIAPEDYYQLTKYRGEEVVQQYVQRGLDAVIIRPTAIYGPGDPGRFLMLFQRAARGRFLMFGDGQTFYHPVYIDNLVDAFELAGGREGITGRAYIIGDERYYTLDELVRCVGRAMGLEVSIRHLPFRPLRCAAWATEMACKPLRVPPPIFRRRVDWFRQNRAFRIDRAREELGYQPAVGIQEGLSRTARWYADKGYLKLPRKAAVSASPAGKL